MDNTLTLQRNATPQQTWTEQQKALIMSTVAPKCTPQQFMLFLEIAKKTGLDPLRKQIYAVIYGDQMVVQTSIDGYLSMAARTGKYGGTCDSQLFVRLKDGSKMAVPHSEYDPDEHTIISGTIGVRRTDRTEPEYSTALFRSYVNTDRSGKPNNFWATMPDVMTLKCALAKALRLAFPDDLSGVYTHEEMGQAQNVPMDVTPATPTPVPVPPATVTIEKVSEQPATPKTPKPKKTKETASVPETYAAVFQFYDQLGYDSDGLTRAKELILAHCGVTEPDDITDASKLAEYCRKQLRLDLKSEGIEPKKTEAA
jgi:phage recombination protein Bet